MITNENASGLQKHLAALYAPPCCTCVAPVDTGRPRYGCTFAWVDGELTYSRYCARCESLIKKDADHA